VDSQPAGITVGSDGKLWFTQTGMGFSGVGNATTTGVVSMMPGRLPLLTGGWARPAFGIVTWSDGYMWLKEEGGFVLDLVTPSGAIAGNDLGAVSTAGVTSAAPFPQAATGLTGVAIGADGYLWFADLDTDTVACFKFTRFHSVVPCLSSPIQIASGSHPFGITAGPDGAMWFTERTGNRVVRVTTAGEVTPFDIPTADSGPTGIAAGPDGNLWFTEQAANRIGRFTPPAGPFAEFSIPTPSSGPFWIAPGPDGALWFTERDADQIGRITPSGAIEEYATPTKPSGPAGIVTGPDGNLWFTESTANQIGQITP
jgi:streptogramin lyase